jgi:hypothetical protein
MFLSKVARYMELFRQIGLGPIYSENNFTHPGLVTTYRKYTLGWKKKKQILSRRRGYGV